MNAFVSQIPSNSSMVFNSAFCFSPSAMCPCSSELHIRLCVRGCHSDLAAQQWSYFLQSTCSGKWRLSIFVQQQQHHVCVFRTAVWADPQFHHLGFWQHVHQRVQQQRAAEHGYNTHALTERMISFLVLIIYRMDHAETESGASAKSGCYDNMNSLLR